MHVNGYMSAEHQYQWWEVKLDAWLMLEQYGGDLGLREMVWIDHDDDEGHVCLFLCVI